MIEVIKSISSFFYAFPKIADIKKAWNRPVVRSTSRGSCIAYYS